MGKVYLVGAGPGAPDLLTLRAADVLGRATIVFYDALVHPDTVALARRAEHVAVGKRCGRHCTAQRFINKRLLDAARKHECVVRLKGGDPLLFGRAQEEIAALRGAGVECEIVPGITSALAASAQVKVSLTQRGRARSVAFVTPRVGKGERANEWARAVMAADTAVIYMGVGEAALIAGTLIKLGMPATRPVVVVENASLPDHREFFLTLAELPALIELSLNGPAIIFIGEAYAHVPAQTLAAKRAVRSA